MATVTTKQRSIKYLARDFESYKRELIEHLRVYFPDTVQDFNESHVGVMLLELMAFMGDNLSFYLDRRFEESFTETAREIKSLAKHAKQLGFKPFGRTSAVGTVSGYLKVPAILQEGRTVPNIRYAGIVKKGAKLKGKNGQNYETTSDADFGTVDITDRSKVQVADVDSTTGSPKSYVLRLNDIPVKAGTTKTTTVTVTGYQAFRKIVLPDEDVLDIISVKDSEGNEWYEVDYLAQDTIFQSVVNDGEDATNVPYVLKLRTVPYRFVAGYDISTNKTSMFFGTGDAQTLDGDLIPDLGDLSLPLFGRDSFSGFSLDPQNFLKTRTLGLAPVNTVLTIQYRIGGGIATNLASTELNSVVEIEFDVGDSSLSAASVNEVKNSFEVLNTTPIQGGKEKPSVEELRQLISAFFAAQDRVVTAPDFVARSLSMPARFGSMFRVNGKPSVLNKNAVELYVLSRDSAGIVSTAPQVLKQNLKTYLGKYRMMTDAIEILDGKVINIAVEFAILVTSKASKSETLVSCISALKDFFKIDVWQMNQPINPTEIIAMLAEIPGVLTVADLQFINKVAVIDGRQYSNTSYNISTNTKNGIVYCTENAIFEVRYPGKDIRGVAR
jgi:hypothetical protein